MLPQDGDYALLLSGSLGTTKVYGTRQEISKRLSKDKWLLGTLDGVLIASSYKTFKARTLKKKKKLTWCALAV